MQKWILQGLLPVVGGVALLLGVVGMGKAARIALQSRETYRVAFRDIECVPPAGLSRSAFLDEVSALTRRSETVQLLDDDFIAQLHRAFLVHPWVESVRHVELKPTDVAKLGIHLDLVYRRPVLAVPLGSDVLGEEETADGQVRLVDRYGVLLPRASVPEHIPVLATEVREPATTEGTRWRDSRVAAAAKTLDFLHAYLTQLRLDDSRVEVIDGEIVFRRSGVRIVWGHAPGQEKADEAPAKEKLRRLLDYQKQHGGLDSLEHDVRMMAYQGHFPLAVDAPITAVSLYSPKQSASSRNCDQVSNSSRSWRSCFNGANAPPTNASSR